MKKSFVLLVGLLLVVSMAASADINSWQIKLGIGDNVYPHGNDYTTRFGVSSVATWNYDTTEDAVHPAIADPSGDLGFVYSGNYYKEYALHGYTWPPAWKPYISGNPTYPNPGLLKDMREPITLPNQPEYWRVTVQSPNVGATMSFIWELNTEAGYEVPDNIYVKLQGNSDLAAAGVQGDLDLKSLGSGQHTITGIPQFGQYLDEDGNPNGVPLQHSWVLVAGVSDVPEPGTIVLMLGGLLGMGGLIRRRK